MRRARLGLSLLGARLSFRLLGLLGRSRLGLRLLGGTCLRMRQLLSLGGASLLCGNGLLLLALLIRPALLVLLLLLLLLLEVTLVAGASGFVLGPLLLCDALLLYCAVFGALRLLLRARTVRRAGITWCRGRRSRC